MAKKAIFTKDIESHSLSGFDVEHHLVAVELDRKQYESICDLRDDIRAMKDRHPNIYSVELWWAVTAYEQDYDDDGKLMRDKGVSTEIDMIRVMESGILFCYGVGDLNYETGEITFEELHEFFQKKGT